MNSARLLAVVIVLQGLLLLGQWTGGASLPHASAQVPDNLNRSSQMVDELRALNSKVDRLVSLLESGKVQVQVNLPQDEKSDRR